MNITVNTIDNQKDAFYIREKVFMEEQGYENEFDEIDNHCYYVTLYDDGKAIGTGRTFKNASLGDDAFVFGRIAVLKEYRGLHFGAQILSELEKVALLNGAKEIYLLSQEYAVGFYEKNGFYLMDENIIYDEGHPHRWMKKVLKKQK